MLSTVLMTGILVVGFLLMFGLVRFSETIITRQEHAADANKAGDPAAREA